MVFVDHTADSVMAASKGDFGLKEKQKILLGLYQGCCLPVWVYRLLCSIMKAECSRRGRQGRF